MASMIQLAAGFAVVILLFFVLLIGIIKPGAVVFWSAAKTRGKVLLVYGLLFLLSIGAAGGNFMYLQKKNEDPKKLAKANAADVQAAGTGEGKTAEAAPADSKEKAAFQKFEKEFEDDVNENNKMMKELNQTILSIGQKKISPQEGKKKLEEYKKKTADLQKVFLQIKVPVELKMEIRAELQRSIDDVLDSLDKNLDKIELSIEHIGNTQITEYFVQKDAALVKAETVSAEGNALMVRGVENYGKVRKMVYGSQAK